MKLMQTASAAALIVVTSLSGLVTATRAEENKALKQLQDANTGNQSTGKTFDGASRPMPSDAFPKTTFGDRTITGTPVNPPSTSTDTAKSKTK